MGIRDRLRRLEERSRDRRPSPEELSNAWWRTAERAKAMLRGESVDKEQRARDRDTVERWQRAEGVDLSVEAENLREKLTDVDRATQYRNTVSLLWPRSRLCPFVSICEDRRPAGLGRSRQPHVFFRLAADDRELASLIVVNTPTPLLGKLAASQVALF